MPSLNCSLPLVGRIRLRDHALGFRNGLSYTLHGVPEHHFYGLLNASSAGRYFNTYLKGRY